MKYSKQLRLLRKPGWILHYVDYELLRRYCNEPSAAFTQHMDNDERGCCDGGGAPATTAEVQVDALIRGLTTEQAQAAFLGALRGELRRANAFFLKQLELLRATLASTVEMTQVAADLNIDDIRVSAARAALLDVSQRMDDLRDFASLNNTAVVKIAKKFDKRWGNEDGGAKTSALPLTQEMLAEHSISSAADIAEMSATAGALARSLPAPAVQGVAKRPVVQPTVDMVTALDISSLPAASFTFCRVQMGTGERARPLLPPEVVRGGWGSRPPARRACLPPGLCPVHCHRLRGALSACSPHARARADPVSEAISMPIMIAKGAHAGPVLGITSAVHGNELNGIPVRGLPAVPHPGAFARAARAEVAVRAPGGGVRRPPLPLPASPCILLRRSSTGCSGSSTAPRFAGPSSPCRSSTPTATCAAGERPPCARGRPACQAARHVMPHALPTRFFCSSLSAPSHCAQPRLL
jgi:hypothetical protein